MRAMKTLLSIASGAAAAVALMLSCNGSSADVDAQPACNCPEAEPPLDGRIQILQEEAQLTAGVASEGVVVACPEGGVMLGGGCNYKDDNSGPISLRRAGPGEQGNPHIWVCTYNGDTVVGTEATIIGTAYCLLPPEE